MCVLSQEMRRRLCSGQMENGETLFGAKTPGE